MSLISKDWSPANRAAICRALRNGYRDVNTLCDTDRHPFFATPNRVYGLGYNRWLIVDYWMEQACSRGWFQGVKPVWITHTKSTGPIQTLELHTENTRVSISHLPSPNATPRDSRLRLERRLDNERCPYLIGWEDAQVEEPGPVNLVLVHGDKEPEFAFLRAYNDPNDLNSYREVSSNLFDGETAVTRIDDENIPDVRVDLLPPSEDHRELGSSGGQ